MNIKDITQIIQGLLSNICNWFSNLNWGTVPDWFAALGTIAAVFVAIYLPYNATKPKGKALIRNAYYTPQFKLMGFEVSFYNTGATAINVRSLSIGVVGSSKNLLLDTTFLGGIIQPGEGYSAGCSAVDVYDAIMRIYGNNKKVEIYPQTIDSLGNIYTGQKMTIDMKLMNKDVEFQRQTHLLNPNSITEENDKLFNTKKLD